MRSSVFLVAGLCCATAMGAGQTRVPEQIGSIQEAVARASAGETIRVHGGTHVGNIVLDKQLTLLGECDPVIRGDRKGPVVTIAATGCVVEGFMIERSGMGMAESDAGILLRSSFNVIERNTIAECLFGMYLDRSNSNTIRSNTIQGMTGLEIGERGSGIHLYDSHRNSIEDNTVADARDGIYFDHANFNTVKSSSFERARYGLHYMSSDENVFIENLFSDCTAGATIMFSRRLTFEGNWFVKNRGFSSCGALLKDCYDSRAVANVFADNSTAMVIDNSMRNLFADNTIARNDVAIHLFSGSDANLFLRNDFTENLSPIRLLGKRSTTRWAEAGRGNHWSDYEGYDLDGDGVGDVPHRIQNVFEYLEGDFPGLRFFLVSPAAAGMKAGESAFPMFEFSREVDPAPLMRPAAMRRPSRWDVERSQPHRMAGVAGFTGIALCLLMIATSRRVRGRRT